MFGYLFFNARLGVELASLEQLRHRPNPLTLSLLASMTTPIANIPLVMLTMQLWHNPDEVHNILIGLAFVASVPIASQIVTTIWTFMREFSPLSVAQGRDFKFGCCGER